MRYIAPGEVDDDKDYLLIGYKNKFGQLDVAKLKLSLLRDYYISTERTDALSAGISRLESYLSSVLDELSGTHDKITTMELSGYCSKARLNEMIDERTFNNSSAFMDYLQANFESKTQVDQATRLSAVGDPLSVANNNVAKMFEEAVKKNKNN